MRGIVYPLNPQEHKSLTTELGRIRAEIDQLKLDIEERKRLLDEKLAKAEELQNRITTPKSVVITEHAYLRYFERVLGYDLKEVGKKILPDETRKLVESLGSGSYPVDNFQVKVKKNVVLTVFVEGK